METNKRFEMVPDPEMDAKANRRRFGERSKWPGLEAIGIGGNRYWRQPVLEATGVVINETKWDGRMTNQVCYYILSRKMKAKEFGQAVRGH